VETYTVFYERDGRPRAGIVVGKTPAGERFLAKIPATEENAIAYLTDGKAEPVGASGFAFTSGNETHWRF
jgi:acetyl-CoA C-acetyltransferase